MSNTSLEIAKKAINQAWTRKWKKWYKAQRTPTGNYKQQNTTWKRQSK